MRILIGEISSYKAIVIARYIRAYYPEAEVWAYDNKPIVRFIHTKHVSHCVRLPFKSIDSYIKALAEYVRSQQIDVLLPVHSDYIGAILKQKDLFGHALSWVGNYEDYIQLHEKDHLMHVAELLGIRVPKTYENIEEARVPFVVKPTNLSSAKGVQYFLTDKSKSLELKREQDYIIQEYIAGQGCGYEVYCLEGKILVEYGHRRLAEWPVSGGSSVLRERYLHPQMRPMAEKILKSVPWTGFAMFEFKVTAENELVLIEVNPRLWGSINQALQDGCPLFDPILGNSKLITKSNKQGVRTCLIPQVWMAMIAYAMKGKGVIVKDYWRNKDRTKRDVNFWSDPKGMISMVLRKML